MKKHYRYLKIFIAVAALLGFAVAARPGDTEAPDPNLPVENAQSTTPIDIEEPNAPAENEQLTGERISRESANYRYFEEPTSRRYGNEQPGPKTSWDVYKIIVERNMFSRQRRSRTNRPRIQRQVPVAPPAPDPESYVVLKGVVQEDGEFIAFLEDTQSGQILRVRQGDSVVRGRITSLTLDSIEYEFEDKTTIVTMGLNLQGGRDGTTFTGMYELSQTYSSASEEDTGESSAPPTEDEAEILRQLMERRQQQVGK